MLFKKNKGSRNDRALSVVKKGVGTEAHQACCSITQMRVGVYRRRGESDDDPDMLRRLHFCRLLARWKIPWEKLPRLKPILLAKMAEYGAVACLGLAITVYVIFSPDYGIFKLLFGLLIGAIALLIIFLMGHHWYTILAKEQYYTFCEHLFGKRWK